VLDEASSSLDGITESAVLEVLNNVAKFKILIIIAHRHTTVKNFDVAYMMN